MLPWPPFKNSHVGSLPLVGQGCLTSDILGISCRESAPGTDALPYVGRNQAHIKTALFAITKLCKKQIRRL